MFQDLSRSCWLTKTLGVQTKGDREGRWAVWVRPTHSTRELGGPSLSAEIHPSKAAVLKYRSATKQQVQRPRGRERVRLSEGQARRPTKLKGGKQGGKHYKVRIIVCILQSKKKWPKLTQLIMRGTEIQSWVPLKAESRPFPPLCNKQGLKLKGAPGKERWRLRYASQTSFAFFTSKQVLYHELQGNSKPFWIWMEILCVHFFSNKKP